MKTTKLFAITLLGLLLFGVSTTLASEGHDDDHGTEVTDHCETPTQELHIKADASSNDFDQDEYKVAKNTCYELKFENPADVTEHDVTIDAVENSDFHFEKAHIHVANHSDGDHGVKSMNIMTPDFDTEMTMYCSVSGHRLSGMEATIIVGNGIAEDGSSLPLDSSFVFLGIVFLSIMAPIIRKSRN